MPRNGKTVGEPPSKDGLLINDLFAEYDQMQKEEHDLHKA